MIIVVAVYINPMWGQEGGVWDKEVQLSLACSQQSWEASASGLMSSRGS